MRGDTGRVGCVLTSCPCGLWSLTPHKMIKRREQVIATDDNPNSRGRPGCPPSTPFSKMDYSPLQENSPRFSASTSLLTWFPLFPEKPTNLSLPVKTLFISQSSVNTSSFKITSLIFPLKLVSLTYLNSYWASFIRKTFFKYLLWPWSYPTC